VLNVVVFLGRVITRLGTLFQCPVKARSQTGGADQARRLLVKSIVVQDAEDFALDIGHTVEGIGEQTAGAWIQGQRHGVDGKVTAAHVVVNGAGRDLGGLAWLVVSLRARAGYLCAHVSRQQQHDGPRGFVHRFRDGAGLFKVFLQFEGVALDRKIQVANDESANDVANRAPGQKYVHVVGTCDIGDQRQGALLIRREPGFHEIDKISHRLETHYGQPGTFQDGRALFWTLRKLHFIQDLDADRGDTNKLETIS